MINNIKEIGIKGEKLAKEFLISNKYKIIKTNFHSPYCEIDIIVKDNDILEPQITYAIINPR